MNSWYDKYESQCWYKNTFLVSEFHQISKVDVKDGEWNNIEGSGCHFVCLSMMIGINPAYLASKLKCSNYFKLDRSLKSKKLDGTSSFLVWDKNEPSKKNPVVEIKNVYHPVKGVVDITIRFLEIIKTNDINETNVLIEKNKFKGNHVICGYGDHSRLVAGKDNDNYYLWDPDLSETEIQKNILGEYDLRWFYNLYSNDGDFSNEVAEYWVYAVEFSL